MEQQKTAHTAADTKPSTKLTSTGTLRQPRQEGHARHKPNEKQAAASRAAGRQNMTAQQRSIQKRATSAGKGKGQLAIGLLIRPFAWLQTTRHQRSQNWDGYLQWLCCAKRRRKPRAWTATATKAPPAKRVSRSKLHTRSRKDCVCLQRPGQSALVDRTAQNGKASREGYHREAAARVTDRGHCGAATRLRIDWPTSFCAANIPCTIPRHGTPGDRVQAQQPNKGAPAELGSASRTALGLPWTRREGGRPGTDPGKTMSRLGHGLECPGSWQKRSPLWWPGPGEPISCCHMRPFRPASSSKLRAVCIFPGPSLAAWRSDQSPTSLCTSTLSLALCPLALSSVPLLTF